MLSNVWPACDVKCLKLVRALCPHTRHVHVLRARVRACARVRLVLRARVRACACTRRGEANIIYCYDIIYSFGGDLDFDDAAKGRLRETFQFAVLCLKQILRSQQRSGPY